MGLEDRREAVEFAQERRWRGRRPAWPQKLADLPEDPGDQAVVFRELVDHRGQFRRGGAQRGEDLVVLTGVMSVHRGTEAEAVAWQIRREIGAGRPVRHLTAQRREQLPQCLVSCGQLLAQRARGNAVVPGHTDIVSANPCCMVMH